MRRIKSAYVYYFHLDYNSLKFSYGTFNVVNFNALCVYLYIQYLFPLPIAMAYDAQNSYLQLARIIFFEYIVYSTLSIIPQRTWFDE